MLARSAERGMGGKTLRTWHNKFGGTGTSQTCKGKTEFKVATAGAGVVITWEVLKTGLHTIACLEAGFELLTIDIDGPSLSLNNTLPSEVQIFRNMYSFLTAWGFTTLYFGRLSVIL